MKGSTIILSFVLGIAVLVMGTAGQAAAGQEQNVIRDHFLQAQRTVQEVTEQMGQQPETLEGTSTWLPGMKKPGRALMYSAFIPGTGELYVGAEKRGIAFLAVEAMAWTWYFTQHSSGKNKEDDFKVFADDEWKEWAYLDWYGHWEDWYDARRGENDPNFSQIFTHHLPGQKNDDYYEMIGKYDQFSYGWIGTPNEYLPGNFAPNDSLLGYTFDQTTFHICRGVDGTATRNRDDYMTMRDDANRLLKRASWGISAALFNHVISAVDAALAAKAYNKGILQEARYPQLRMEVDRYAGEYIPKFTITQKF
jgi:hypothetical protein